MKTSVLFQFPKIFLSRRLFLEIDHQNMVSPKMLSTGNSQKMKQSAHGSPSYVNVELSFYVNVELSVNVDLSFFINVDLSFYVNLDLLCL